MAVLLVTYALKNKLRDYSPLFEAIKANADGWLHYIDDTWIVNTATSANDFAYRLLPFIQEPDRLLVVKIAPEYQGWLPTQAWEWLNARTYQ